MGHNVRIERTNWGWWLQVTSPRNEIIFMGTFRSLELLYQALPGIAWQITDRNL